MLILKDSTNNFQLLNDLSNVLRTRRRGLRFKDKLISLSMISPHYIYQYMFFSLVPSIIQLFKENQKKLEFLTDVFAKGELEEENFRFVERKRSEVRCLSRRIGDSH